MKHQFTPGPWTVALGGESEYMIIGDKWPVCTLDKPHATQDATEKANARLIAAAPDLYAVVELILKEWEKPTEGVQRGELIARLSQYSVEARAALKKARGTV